MLTTFSWDDKNVRRVFIRKVRDKSLWLSVTRGRQQPSSEPSEGPGCYGFGFPALAGKQRAGGLPTGCLSLQVYAILMVQLLVTVVIVAFFTFW